MIKFDDKIPIHSIVRKPCPHCYHLCPSKAKNCPKCGEPLVPLENTASKEKNVELIEERSNEKVYIKLLEQKIGRRIPQVKNIKRGSLGFVMDGKSILGLSLYNCRLESIPQEIFNLEAIKTLYLRRNCIKILPSMIGFLNNIEELILSINEIETVPQSIGLLNELKVLMLDSNKIRSLPETICSLKKLEKLHLANNQLRELPTNLIDLPSLETLDVRGNLLLKIPTLLKKSNKHHKKVIKQSSLDEYL